VRKTLLAVLVIAVSACRPPRAPEPAFPINASFDCEGVLMAAMFDRDRVVLTLYDGNLTLPQVVSASGARYSDGRDTFWDRGAEATLERGGRTQICRRGYEVE
jgi:putative lipoprotein